MSIHQLLVTLLIISFASCVNGSSHQSTKTEIVSIKEPYDTTFYFLNGQKIFRNDCNACHVAKGKRHNYLEGVVQRAGEDYLKLYITKQDSLIAAKDKYALELKEKWGNLGNCHNFRYTEKQIMELIEYLR
jgi:hypothetical protein